VPASATDSKEENAAPSRRCLHSKDTLETDVIRFAEGSWPKASCGLFSDSDALASGPAKSPVCLRVGLSRQSVMCG